MTTKTQRTAHEVVELQMEAMTMFDHFLAHKTVQGNPALSDGGLAIRSAMYRANQIACYCWFRDEIDEPIVAGTPSQVIRAHTEAIRAVMRLKQHSTIWSNDLLREFVNQAWQAIITANALVCVLMEQPDLEPGLSVAVRAA